MINKRDARVDYCSLHKHSFQSLNFQLLKVHWTVTEHCTGLPIHTTAEVVTVTQWLLMGRRVTDPLTLPRDQRPGVPHTLCFLLHYRAHTLCNPALPAPAHTPGTARKRDEELQKNSLRRKAPTCFKFCSQQLTALSMRPLQKFSYGNTQAYRGFYKQSNKNFKTHPYTFFFPWT